MTLPFPVSILGAGRMAQRIAQMLGQDARFDVALTSRDGDALAAIKGLVCHPPLVGDLQEALADAIRGRRAVILADPTLPAADVARVAVGAGCHYLDITESAVSSAAVGALHGDARGAGVCLAPGCGLAPGYVTALAAEALGSAGLHDEITVFVGVLPAKPDNRLGYANIWGIEGLVGEYSSPCFALRGGQLAELPPLSEPETIYLNGKEFEAFTTAGSLDALARAHEGRVGGLLFKTLRFPGHLDYIRFLLEDLGLSKRLYQFRSLLATALPCTEDDHIIIAIRRRTDATESWTARVLEAVSDCNGQRVSAISTATASHVCATLDLILSMKAAPGFIAPGVLLPTALRNSAFFCHLDPAGVAFHVP